MGLKKIRIKWFHKLILKGCGRKIPAEKIMIKMIPIKIATEAVLIITIGMIFDEMDPVLVALVALLTKNGSTFEDGIFLYYLLIEIIKILWYLIFFILIK